jgi:hypothetical protein
MQLVLTVWIQQKNKTNGSQFFRVADPLVVEVE